MSHAKIISNQESQSVTIKLTKTFTLIKNEKKKRYDEVFFVIYKTTNLLKNDNEENRFYVGQHIQYNVNPYEFDGYLGSGTILLESIKKYGKENFVREILEVCNNAETMAKREIYWIEFFKSNKRKYPECGGMNLNYGGNNNFNKRGKNHYNYGKHLTEETKEKISKNSKSGLPEVKEKIGNSNKGKHSGENNYWHTHEFTEEHKRKIGEKSKGRKKSEEECKKISERMTGEKHPNFGKKASKELIEKKSKARLENPMGENHPSIKYNYELSNGENYWKFFSSFERSRISYRFNTLKYLNLGYVEYKGIKIKRSLKKEYVGIFKEPVKIKKERHNVKIKRKHLNDKYLYFLSNEEDFYEFFDSKDRKKIKNKFNKQKNIKNGFVTHKNITIIRKLNECYDVSLEKENVSNRLEVKEKLRKYNYKLSNDQDYWTFFDKNEKHMIFYHFKKSNKDYIEFKGIIITRILNEKYKKR